MARARPHTPRTPEGYSTPRQTLYISALLPLLLLRQARFAVPAEFGPFLGGSGAMGAHVL